MYPQMDRHNSKDLPFSKQLKQLLFKNHTLMIKYISNNQKSLEYIAKHYFDISQVDLDAEDNIQSFKLQV